MKATKKQKRALPEVHILGDLEDVKALVERVNKKKTLVIFHDREQEDFYLEIEGEFQEIRQKDIAQLEKKYSLVFFSFFPGRRKPAAAKKKEIAVTEPETEPVAEKEKENKKEKKEKAGKKETKEKKEKKDKKEK